MVAKKLLLALMSVYALLSISCGSGTSGSDLSKTENIVPKSKSVRVYDMEEFRNDFFKIENDTVSFDGYIVLNSNAASQIEGIIYQSIVSVANVDLINFTPIEESRTTRQNIDLENDKSLVIGTCSSLDDIILDYHYKDRDSCESKVQQEGSFISGVESFDESGTSTGISVIIAYNNLDDTSIDSAKENLRNFLDFKTSIFYSYTWDYDFTQPIPYPLKETTTLPEGMEHYSVKRKIMGEGVKNILVVPVYSGEPMPERLLNNMKDPTQIDSFYYCGQWFENQASLRGIDLEINFDFPEGQYHLPEELQMDNDPSTPDCYISSTYGRKFLEYLREVVPNSSHYDMIVPIYYSDTNTLSGCSPNASEESFIMFVIKYAEGQYNPTFNNEGNFSKLACHEL
ncbi:hypothetical protein KY308_01125, partial [Candidatus Woesearchaeota archaeon]|nr:hypothetical protein [Candidatus Woesearchaeota archaeon]